MDSGSPQVNGRGWAESREKCRVGGRKGAAGACACGGGVLYEGGSWVWGVPTGCLTCLQVSFVFRHILFVLSECKQVSPFCGRCRSTYVGTKQVIFICRSADSHGFYYLACHYESSKMMLSFSHHALVPLLEVTGAATRTFSNRPRKRLAAQRFSLGINGSKRGLLEETCARRWLGP